MSSTGKRSLELGHCCLSNSDRVQARWSTKCPRGTRGWKCWFAIVVRSKQDLDNIYIYIYICMYIHIYVYSTCPRKHFAEGYPKSAKSNEQVTGPKWYLLKGRAHYTKVTGDSSMSTNFAYIQVYICIYKYICIYNCLRRYNTHQGGRHLHTQHSTDFDTTFSPTLTKY